MEEEYVGKLTKKLREACKSIGGETVEGFPVCLADNIEIHLEGVEPIEAVETEVTITSGSVIDEIVIKETEDIIGEPARLTVVGKTATVHVIGGKREPKLVRLEL